MLQAVRHNRMDEVRVHARGARGAAMAHLAARRQAEVALDAGAAVDSRDESGNTAFLLAAQQGLKRMCKLLLRRGADMNARNLRGNTALHYCHMYGFADLGASPQVVAGLRGSDRRHAPLSRPAQYFVSKGADDTLANAEGLTCYEVAAGLALAAGAEAEPQETGLVAISGRGV